MTTIVFGPPGCGKTTNAELLKKHFGERVVVDGWDGVEDLPHNALALTVCQPVRVPRGAMVLTFASAMKKVRRA